uniref:(California timema) hypothetical protein n=1 Tax=Timema californicum TaxID=61474 RepID=A0A7R9IVB2_TIMCA|nr:unnamed protein product [Timema californicum]
MLSWIAEDEDIEVRILLGAAREVWGNSLHEYFNVDCCAEMNNLASLLLRDGKEDKEMPLKGVFYRQFLPASHSVSEIIYLYCLLVDIHYYSNLHQGLSDPMRESLDVMMIIIIWCLDPFLDYLLYIVLFQLKYDIVVSAYALFELPSSESRLETILALWNKTQAYLVIVEQGTNAGFKIVNEARDFILYSSKNDDNLLPQAHVFAPVSHRPVEDRQWPRLVSPTLIRHKHAICRMCSSAGKLDEIIFTVSRHGK